MFVNRNRKDIIMRIIWKDSCAIGTKPVRYRQHYIYPYGAYGWIIDFPDDKNIYSSHYSAMNAIDLILGQPTRRNPSEKRKRYGIKIVGHLDE